MSRKPLISGNWKMNLNHFEAIQLVQKLNYELVAEDYEAVEFSPSGPMGQVIDHLNKKLQS